MKRLLLVLFVISATLLHAADIIITRSSTKINAIIEEVGTTSIKYRTVNNPKGPLVVLETNQIATIIYGNGEVQTFEEEPVVEQPATPAPQTMSPLPQTMSPYPQTNYPSAYPQNNYGMGGYQFVDYKAIEQHRKDSIKDAQKAAKKAAFKAKVDAIPRKHFLLANYTYTFGNKSHNVGLTYGWCHVAGVYVNATLGISGFHYKTDGFVGLDDWSSYYYSDRDLTNTHTTQRISFNTGLMVRLGCPLYFMGGVGYCYHTLAYKATNGDWMKVRNGSESNNAMTYQVGLLADIKGFSLMASFGGYVYEKHQLEVSIGIGCAINGKKGGKK